jgi:hypothetical protein
VLVYLGYIKDVNKQLGDSAFKFLSSYCFTLFKTENVTADFLSQVATAIFLGKNVAAATANFLNETVPDTCALGEAHDATGLPTNAITNKASYSQPHNRKFNEPVGESTFRGCSRQRQAAKSKWPSFAVQALSSSTTDVRVCKLT